jgi:hypothetical protein
MLINTGFNAREEYSQGRGDVSKLPPGESSQWSSFKRTRGNVVCNHMQRRSFPSSLIVSWSTWEEGHGLGRCRAGIPYITCICKCGFVQKGCVQSMHKDSPSVGQRDCFMLQERLSRAHGHFGGCQTVSESVLQVTRL